MKLEKLNGSVHSTGINKASKALVMETKDRGKRI